MPTDPAEAVTPTDPRPASMPRRVDFDPGEPDLDVDLPSVERPAGRRTIRTQRARRDADVPNSAPDAPNLGRSDGHREPADSPGTVVTRALAAACAKVAEVTEERDNARADAATLRAELARFKGDPDQVRAELAKAIEERDLAIAHDRQPYPTADAYERACAAREKHRERADKAEAALARVRRVHFQYRTAWTDEFDTCAGCNRGMDLVPWPCPTIQALDGQQTPGGAE